MTNDNQDALRCAEKLDVAHYEDGDIELDAADHLRRLVRDNEAKDALMRQAVAALEADRDQMLWPLKIATMKNDTLKAIRQHLDQKTA